MDNYNKSCKYLNSNDMVKLLIGIFLFRIITDLIYSKYVATIFNYTGFECEFNFGRMLLSWFILGIFLPIILNLHKNISFSSVIVILLSYLSIIPFTTMVAYYPFELNYILQNVVYWLVLFLFYKFVPRIKLKRMKNDKLTYLIINIILILFSSVIVYISYRYTGFRITLNIFNVYDLRSEASSFMLPTVLSYIYSASKAVNPILLIYSLSIKRHKLAILIFIIQILSFSINGSKTVLLSTILAVVLYWLYNQKYLHKIPWILATLGILSIFEIWINETIILISFIIRRVYFVPNLLNYYYFDFFSNNSPDYFRQSFLRHFGLQSPYSDISNLMGLMYFNKPEMSANNGLFSDAYANLGILGLIIMPFILVIALKFLDACAEGLDDRIFIISAIIMSFIFISSFFFTILLTHGFIAVCIILYLLPRKSISLKRSNI